MQPPRATPAIVLVLLISTSWAHSAMGQLPHVRTGPPAQIDVNRPRTPFDCDLPIGVSWYGSSGRCLAELCAGRNEYVFEANRRRKNPCYGQSPTDYPEDK